MTRNSSQFIKGLCGPTAAVLIAANFGGCSTSALTPPDDGWNVQHLSHSIQSAPNSGSSDETIALQPRTPTLQIITCHGRVHGTHCALMLMAPEGTVFWDPAGRFGADDPRWERQRDTFADPAPTLDDYLAWRFKGAGDQQVAVFEWRLTHDEAGRLRDILLGERPAADTGRPFRTTTPGMACCAAVCEFLDRLVDGVTVPQRWLMPERLAEHLWSQRPNRVLLYRADGSLAVLEPSIGP